MAFTKITAAGIGSTETVTLDGLSVINDGSFGGNVSVGGTLTYEDVTNIDSVGLITARAGVNVGSGITLSKDGDVFFTGIATGNGSGLTALNASNISSGTVPTARLGSGTASSSTFLAGDSTFKTVTGTTINNNADNRVITGSDSANTLEGEANLTYDGSTLKINGGLIEIAHTSCHLDFMETSTTNHRLRNGSGNFQIQKISDDKNTTTTQFLVDGGTGAVELYHNGTKQCETAADGLAFPSGKGINFNATADSSASGATAGSELLDDYEEGSWTPQIRKFVNGNFGTAAGMADNGTVSRSTYTKIGNVVTLFLHWDGFQVSDANYAALGGLPFNTANSGGGGGNVGYTDAFTNNPNNGLLVGSNGDVIYFYVNSNAWNGWSTSSNRSLYLQATYLTS